MNIEISVHGHQHYERITGEVLAWTQCVEKYDSGKATMQVPCLIIKVDGLVRIVPLQSENKWTELKVLA